MRIIIIFFAAALLTGCQTKSVEEMSYSELREYALSIHKRCEAQGVVSESEMRLCMNQELTADATKRRKAIQTGRAISQALASTGENMQRNAAMNRPINCTSTGFGNTINTRCFLAQ